MNLPVDLSNVPELSTAARIARIRALYDAGLYVQAWQAGQPFGELPDWPGCEAQILAARLGSQLGANRLCDWLCRRAFNTYPDDAEAKYFYGYVRLRRRGPYFAWRWYRQNPELPPPAEPHTLASWKTLWAEVAAQLRDFDTAENLMREALAIAPDYPWVRTSRATILMHQDRYEESLAAAREALEIHPWYRAAVNEIGHLLSLLDRDEEALEFLQEGSERLECASVTAQLLALQMELNLYQPASKTLNRIEQLFPLADKKITSKWLAAQRAEISYYLGDYDAAVKFAEGSDSEFQKAIAERLKIEANRNLPAVTLPVGFVRQHHNTCGPATLAAISRYWQMPADHLEVADEICYNGTSNYNERKWAQSHGWIVREFTITEEATQQIIDRGIPFTFTTIEPGGGHLQAVIGYDARRRTLLIRDPYWRTSGEALADKVLERYRPYGPRGLALVPQGMEEKLAGLELPDTELWDLLHQIDAAVEGNRRQDAEAILAQLNELAPAHRLTFEARRRLAIYDGNTSAHLAAVEAMLGQFPDCATLQLERLSLFRVHARRKERLEIYKKMCDQKETHPIFWQRYADELRDDGRQHENALQLVRRAIRRWPSDSYSYTLLGHLYWDERRFDEALELYRFASCLSETDEHTATTLFSAARYFKRTDETIAFLRQRFQRFGKKSGHPARTLATSLFQIDRDEEALALIEEAIQLRPDDGSLLLYAANSNAHSGTNRLPRAHELLELAKNKASRTEWLSASARLAESEGRLHDALALWKELSDLQPLNITAHQAVVRLLASTESRAAALERLQAAAERFPHSVPLFEVWIDWLRDEPDDVMEPVLRRGIAQFPDNAWLLRQLAFLLANSRRQEEARSLNKLSAELEPHNPAWRALESDFLHLEGKHAEAQEMLREILRTSIDYDYAINKLMDGCPNLKERRKALAFVKEQLVTQVIFGEGLLAFRDHARGTLEDEELLVALRDALAARPDLWHAWSAVVQQLLGMNRLDEAWELAVQATKRFPLLPNLWLYRSQIAHARLDDEAEEEALRAALAINPSWNHAVLGLADLFERQERIEEAATLLRHAVARNPLDPVLHQNLGETLWRMENKEEAVERAKQALRLEPGYDRAWDYLHKWGSELNSDPSLEMARELTQERAGEARSWIVLGRLLDKEADRPERYAALAKALELNPRSDSAYDWQARTLAAEGKYDEALAACNAPIWEGHPPSELRARAAWIEAERHNVVEAIQLMESVVEESPGFFGAWSRLADWYQFVGDKAGYLRAAEALVKLDPQYEVSLGYLGEARLLNGDRPGAIEALMRAFELEPRYEFAGTMLFDLQLEDGKLDEAVETIERVQRHSDSSDVFARRAQLAGKQKETAPVLEAFEHLIADVECRAWPFDVTMQAAQDAGCNWPVEDFLHKHLPDEKLNLEAVRCWVELKIKRSDWPTQAEVKSLMSQPDRGRAAVNTFLRQVSDRQNLLAFQQLVAGDTAWLREDTFCWADVGRAYCSVFNYSAAWDWMSDWRERTDIQPWMLVNVAEACRATNRVAEAGEVSRYALTLPRAHGQHLHHLFLGLDAAETGRTDLAREELAAATAPGEPQMDYDYTFLAKLVGAVVEVDSAHAAARPVVFQQWWQELTKLKAGHPAFNNEPERKRLYRTIRQRLATIRGGFAGMLAQWQILLGW